jgi:hypothetical protein
MEKAEIIGELKRLAEADGGKTPGRERFARETGIAPSYWEGRYWAKWSDLCRDAGLQPGTYQAAGDGNQQLGELADLVRLLGRFPTIAEMTLRRRQWPEFPDPGVFKKLGKKADKARALASWCSRHDGYDDVAGICRSVVTDLDSVPLADAESQTRPGTVYLIKSGSNFKVGMTTRGSGRRHREIDLQLPERARLVHEIPTDDAPGIEAYWHRRFADRRLNGEWFALNKADVAAFRSRRLM